VKPVVFPKARLRIFGRTSKNGTGLMYKLSEAAAHDIEQLLDQSILDFGLLQTEAYYHDLTHCLALLADNPEMGNSAEEIRSCP
jgi:plasmid stabilization system protein ParE